MVLADPAQTGNWAFSRTGLYFMTSQSLARGRRSTIRFLDFASGQVTDLFHGPFGLAYVDVSPDEEWILYAGSPAATSELMLVESFR